MRKVKIDGKWKMLPVASVGEGDARRWDFARVMVAGKPLVAEGGTFYLDYWEDGRKRRAVGTHRRDAKVAIATQASVLGLRAQGVVTADAPQLRPRVTLAGKSIRNLVESFVEAPPLRLRPKSFAKYRNALETFLAWSIKQR